MGHAITRRRFLIGASTAAVVVAGTGGTVAATHPHQVHRFLHAHGVLGGPDARIPDARADVTFGELESDAMKRRVGYGLSLPAAPATAALICLHGRGGTHRDPFDDLGVHRFVAAASLPFAVAAVDGGESFWHARADGTDASKLVLDEVMPMVAAKAPDAVPVLLGWSMGAYGALLLAEQHPGTFGAVVASSPTIWRTAGESATGAFDDAEDFARNDVLAGASALIGEKTRIDCGEDDVFADVSRDLVRNVPGASGGVRPGYHESATWRSFLPDQLGFIRSRVS
jgi:pimeloyl-ACP methyl ester carboxylesterase